MTTLVAAFDNGSLASDVYVAFDKFLGIPISPGYRFMFLLTTQALSFGFAGMFHRFLIRPAFCIFPGTLPTFHRMKFFWLALVIAGSWQVVPSFLFTSLTTFAWITWIKPGNVTINQIFGATTGMDLLPLTLDGNQVAGYLASPLVVPSWAIFNVLGGSIFFLWIISPALHWANIWYGRYFPFSSSSTFDNTGMSYNTSRVMNPDYTINDQVYAEYSPVFLSTTSIFSYGLVFASITSILVHTFLYHGKTLMEAFKAALKNQHVDDQEDIHGQLMRRYKTVPEWWYGIIFCCILAVAMAFIYVEKTGLPWWGLIISILINLVLLLPIGLMQATCNITVNTGVIAALIAGFIWPGNMMNNVVFKIFTLVCTFQGLGYINAMKIGHYMKIPPRVTFVAQCTSIIVSWLVQTAVNLWAMGNFYRPLANGYAANAVFWGLIGPTKLFKAGSMYNSMLWFFLIGAILPIMVYVAHKKMPNNTILKKIHTPATFASTSSIPPATAANYMTWGAIGLTFNFFIKRRYRNWWSKYNYLLSASLDSGLAITTFLVFFS
ncbi:Fc.00g025060.m01.CDS01 [Cosmosporella sp. VM-42]